MINFIVINEIKINKKLYGTVYISLNILLKLLSLSGSKLKKDKKKHSCNWTSKKNRWIVIDVNEPKDNY